MIKVEWVYMCKYKLMIIVMVIIMFILLIYVVIFLWLMWDLYGWLNNLFVVVVNYD